MKMKIFKKIFFRCNCGAKLKKKWKYCPYCIRKTLVIRKLDLFANLIKKKKRLRKDPFICHCGAYLKKKWYRCPFCNTTIVKKLELIKNV